MVLKCSYGMCCSCRHAALHAVGALPACSNALLHRRRLHLQVITITTDPSAVCTPTLFPVNYPGSLLLLACSIANAV